VFYGAALGNVVRGAPLDGSGYFFEPLWTNFRLGEETGILDWYTILVGLPALTALVMHGGLWVQWKTSGTVCARAAQVAGGTWCSGVALTLLVNAVTFQVQPQVKENFTTWPWGNVFPLLAVAGAAGVKFELAKKDQPKSVFCLVRLSDRNANECRVWRLSHGAARPQSRVLADGDECERRSLRLEDRACLVNHRDDPGLLHIPVPIVCGQGRRGREPARVRRVTSRCRAVLANT
jgi:hypothetical protein